MAEKKDSNKKPSTELEHGKVTDEVIEAVEGANADDDTDRGDTLGADVHVSDEAVPDALEVAARSADMETASNLHRKVFVLGGVKGNDKNPYTEANGFDHEPNYAAVRQYAINAGLWPTGPVKFAGAKRHADGISWELAYEVPVKPAHAVGTTSDHPEVIGDDTSDEGASKAVNADPDAPDAGEVGTDEAAS